MKKIVEYEIVRLFAMICVVAGHSCYTHIGYAKYQLYCAEGGGITQSLWTMQNYLVGFVYSFHMPLFFLLAGAVFCNSLEHRGFSPARTFVVKKTRRLLLPYLFYGVLFMIPVKFLMNWWAPNEAFSNIVRNYVVDGASSGHLWFLVSLFMAYVMVYGVARLVQGVTVWSVLMVNALCWFLCFWGVRWGNFLPHAGEAATIFSSKFLLCMSLGMLIHKAKPAIDEFVRRWGVAALLLMLTLLLYQVTQYERGRHWPVIFSVLVFLEVYLLAGFVLRFDFVRLAIDRPWFWFVSKNLMGVYLIHDPLNYVILDLYRRFGLFDLKVEACWVSLFRFVGLFLISLLLSWVIGRAIGIVSQSALIGTLKRRFCTEAVA